MLRNDMHSNSSFTTCGTQPDLPPSLPSSRATSRHSARSSSNGRRPILALRGFLYDFAFYNTEGTKIFWRCHERQQCNAVVLTSANLRRPSLLWDGTDRHTHAPDHARIGLMQFMRRVRERVRDGENTLAAGDECCALVDPAHLVAAEASELEDGAVLRRVGAALPAIMAGLARARAAVQLEAQALSAMAPPRTPSYRRRRGEAGDAPSSRARG